MKVQASGERFAKECCVEGVVEVTTLELYVYRCWLYLICPWHVYGFPDNVSKRDYVIFMLSSNCNRRVPWQVMPPKTQIEKKAAKAGAKASAKIKAAKSRSVVQDVNEGPFVLQCIVFDCFCVQLGTSLFCLTLISHLLDKDSYIALVRHAHVQTMCLYSMLAARSIQRWRLPSSSRLSNESYACSQI